MVHVILDNPVIESLLGRPVFGWLFSTVYFPHVCPQSTWIRWGIVSLVTFGQMILDNLVNVHFAGQHSLDFFPLRVSIMCPVWTRMRHTYLTRWSLTTLWRFTLLDSLCQVGSLCTRKATTKTNNKCNKQTKHRHRQNGCLFTHDDFSQKDYKKLKTCYSSGRVLVNVSEPKKMKCLKVQMVGRGEVFLFIEIFKM